MGCGCHKRALLLEDRTGVSAWVWHAAVAGVSVLLILAMWITAKG